MIKPYDYERKLIYFGELFGLAMKNKTTKIESNLEDFIFHCNVCKDHKIQIAVDILNYKIILENGNEIHYKIENKLKGKDYKFVIFNEEEFLSKRSIKDD